MNKSMDDERFDFSLADPSSQPYAWMVEGVDKAEAREWGSAEDYVENYARVGINATNYSDESDEEIYRRWREDTWEYDQAVAWINEWLEEA